MKTLTLILIFFASSLTVRANNIQVKNITLANQNTAQKFTYVKFDLSWENSWRVNTGPNNWDAAWVFARFRVGGGAWSPVWLNLVDGSNDGHIVPSGVAIRTEAGFPGASWGVGSFVHRSAPGIGNVDWQNIQLRWNYGQNSVADVADVEVQVFAIEMVYVPKEEFYIGDGTGGSGNFYTYPNFLNPYKITSEGAISIGATNGNLYYTPYSSTGDGAGPVPAEFPKGYNAFYCMKYEMSQGQWTAFFNTLSATQKPYRDVTDATHKNSDAEVSRNTISWDNSTYGGSKYAYTTTPDRPVNYLKMDDTNAYWDWAGLRPMSELEFEKSCRGPKLPLAVEPAWGTLNIYQEAYQLSNDGTAEENIINMGEGTGNVLYNYTDGVREGPLRCGIFAANAKNQNRQETGGSYYGIMELSGNLTERIVNIGNVSNRNYSGLHGNGYVDITTGGANVVNWPSGGGNRGGSLFSTSIAYVSVSLRQDANRPTDNYYFDGAGRGVRTIIE